MYSGMFTHYIKPVLSMQHIEKLFGLLGYQPSPSQHEQLLLQALRISPASLDDLLQLSCAFYLARCECRLLGTTLGKHVGDAQWELSVIRERQRGNSLQVCLSGVWQINQSWGEVRILSITSYSEMGCLPLLLPHFVINLIQPIYYKLMLCCQPLLKTTDFFYF